MRSCARGRDERAEEIELTPAEMDRAAFDPGRAVGEVEEDVAGLQRRHRCRGPDGALARAHPRDELVEGERLHQVVVGAELEAGHDVLDLGTRRQHEDLGRVAPASDLTEHIEAVDVRQPEVEHHEVGAGRRGHRVPAARDPSDVVPPRGQAFRQERHDTPARPRPRARSRRGSSSTRSSRSDADASRTRRHRVPARSRARSRGRARSRSSPAHVRTVGRAARRPPRRGRPRRRAPRTARHAAPGPGRASPWRRGRRGRGRSGSAPGAPARSAPGRGRCARCRRDGRRPRDPPPARP